MELLNTYKNKLTYFMGKYLTRHKAMKILRMTLPCVLAFFMGRIELGGRINPAVIALAGCYCFKKASWAVFVCSALGLISVINRLEIAPYIISLIIMSIFDFLGNGNNKGRRISIFTSALSVLSGCLIYYSFAEPSFYMVTLSLVEAALTALLCYLFTSGTELLRGSEREYIMTEEALGALLIGLGVICGCGEIRIFGISMLAFLSSLLIYICCERGGAALGIGFGAIEGVVMYFAGLYSIEIIPVVVLGAVLAFIGGKAHRLLVPVGYILAAAPIAAYFNLDLGDGGSVAAMILAGIANRLLPMRLYICYSSFINTGVLSSEKYAAQLREVTVERLNSLSNIFDNIAQTYSTCSNYLNSSDSSYAYLDFQNISVLLCRSIEQDICGDCPLAACCFKGSRENKKTVIADFVNKWLINLKVSESNIPESFKQCCRRYRAMQESAEYYVELLRLESSWRDKLEKTKNLVTDQMSTVSRVIAQVGRELMQEMNIDKQLSARLYKALYEYGITGAVACRGRRAMSIYITLPRCIGEKRCTSRIIPIVNSILPVRVKRSCSQCNTCDGICRLELVQEPPIRVAAFCVGQARTGSEASGDSFSYADMGGGHYLLALADGMGSGEQARGESCASIELYEDFISAGFDRATAVDLINSVLLMGEQRECYSTLDICNIDLFSGRAEFIKIGAINTYLLHSNEMEKIGSSTLPVGILHRVDSFVCERQLEKGDKLIMLTDGILESDGRNMSDEWLMNIILKNKTITPKALAHKILDCALSNCRGNSEDDMSVLVASLY